MAKAKNSRNISTKIILEGEKEFKSSLAETDKSLSALRSEMTLVDAEFKGQANSMDALQAKHDTLSKQYAEQSERVEKLKKRTEELNKQNDEVSKRLGEVQKKLSETGISAEDLGKYYKKARDNSEDLTEQQKKLLKESETLEKTSAALSDALYKNGKDANYSQAKLLDLNRELQKTDGYLNEAKQSADKCAKSIDEFGKETGGAQSGIEKFTDVLQNGFSSMGGKGGAMLSMLTSLKGALIGGAIVSGLKELGDAIIGVVDDTAEYRKIMGTLETSSKEAGYTTEQTAEAYTRLNGVLGDSQTAATTVANLQAIGLSQSDLMTLVDATTGAWATYGDSIPIDGLSEAINETIQTGKVTGTFADVLNWAGESEDDFNAKLEGANTTSERAQIVLNQLSKQNLPQAGKAWRDANEDIIEYNEAQGELDEAMGRLGEALAPVASKMKGVFADAVNWAADAVSKLLGWIDKAITALNKMAGVEEKQKTTITKGQSKTTSKTTSTVRQYANGLDYVPYDGYPAILHEGERVLTRREADDYRSDRGSGKPADIVINLTTTLDGKAVSKAVTRYQQQDQRART